MKRTFKYDLEISVDIFQINRNYPNGGMFRCPSDFAKFMVENILSAANGYSDDTNRDYGYSVKLIKKNNMANKSKSENVINNNN